jgi:Mn-dependent DtxR family transcriptional regulator
MDGKLILTGEEIAAMRAIDSAVALGQSTEKIADVPQRLFEQGVVEKSGGGLVLTGRGRKLLRASNLQG